MILPVGALAVKPRNRNRFSVIKDVHSSEQLSEDFILVLKISSVLFFRKTAFLMLHDFFGPFLSKDMVIKAVGKSSV